MTTQQKKINAAKMALKRIRPGMCVGLGTGSTTNEFINLLGQEKQLLKTLRYASSSIQTEMFAKKYSIIWNIIIYPYTYFIYLGLLPVRDVPA